MKAGIQVSSFRPVLKTEAQVLAAFKEMSQMNCKVVQLQWIDYSVPVDVIARAVQEYGMTAVGTQEFYEIFQEHYEYFLELNEKTGGKYLTVSRVPDAYKSREGLAQFCRILEDLIGTLKEKGLTLCFHPTHWDYEDVQGITPVDYLMEHVPELELCLDLYHCNRMKRDIPAMLERYRGRVPMVHFKEGKFLPDGKEILVPVGSGVIDWSGAAEACEKNGVHFAFAEQESWEGDPFEALGAGYRWLSEEIKKTGKA